MIEFFEALRTNPILLTSVIAGFAASIVSGIIGSYVVVKRIVFISGSISHSVLAGLGLSVWLERSKGIFLMPPLSGALLAAIGSAWIIGWIYLYYREREDTVIAALWSIGMAVGVLFISQTPGSNVELANFLVGNILWVSPTDLAILFGLDLLVLGVVLCLHKRFLAICFDEDQARLQGISVSGLYILLLMLTAVAIVLLIQVVGVILVMTMLTIPAAIANLFTSRLSFMMMIAVVISAIFSFSGTAVAYHFDMPSGATIALIAGIAYVISLLAQVTRRT